MKARAAAVMLLLVSACHGQVEDNATPSPTHVERLERKLAKHPCVGDLTQWERNYRFSRKSGLLSPHALYPDLDVIELHLRRVGTVRITPQRNVMTPGPGGDWPDSSPIRSIDGKFTLSSGALKLARCEPVSGGDQPA